MMQKRKYQKEKTHTECAKDFNEAAGIVCLKKPVEIGKEHAKYYSKMILSELHEFLCTVSETPAEALSTLTELVGKIDLGVVLQYPEEDKFGKKADQADALTDIIYYSHNTASRYGMNLEPVFRSVHEANMKKCDPKTNRFIRREDGKIIKPPGWKAPDISKEIEIQDEKGSWSVDDSDDFVYLS